MYSDNETSYTSASEEIGSEDSPDPEALEGADLCSSSSSTTQASPTTPASPTTRASPTTPASPAADSSPASSPRRSPRLAEKRSRILEKQGVNFRPKRRRYDTGAPPHMIIVPVSSLPHPRAAGPPVPGKTINMCTIVNLESSLKYLNYSIER
ncbi:hypothetical protein CDAR_109601 [Caerostris darwini]|uniref:Uncharacterized protein n=1 Tax=Caerostris darwini TaxID=1538125 RepID=A0AAV4TXW7_9ARAC|nr:hypothetical protein CDAR_109601 [Caerostris darwini]